MRVVISRAQGVAEHPMADPIRRALIRLTALAAPAVAARAQGLGVPLRVGGSGTGVGLMERLANDYSTRHADERFEFQAPWGNEGAYRAVRVGRLDLAIVNRPEAAPPRAGDAALAVNWLARTPQVFAVHRDTGLRDLSLADLTALHREEVFRLPSGQRLRPVLRPDGSGTARGVASLAPGLAAAMRLAQQRAGMLRAVDELEALRLIEEVPGAVGAVTLAAMLASRRPLVALAFEGRVPSVAELEARRYPLQRQFYVVSTPLPSPKVLGFVSFIRSDVARATLATLGCSTRLSAEHGTATAPARVGAA